MKTTNIISTPNISGNIGSCTIQSNEVQVANRFFTEDYRVVQINSCTGQIVGDYTYTSYIGIYVAVVLAVGFLVMAFVGWLMSF